MPETYEKDSVIYEQGEEISSINYLLEGELDLVYKIEVENTIYELIFSKIKNNTFFGVENFYDTRFSNYGVECHSDVTVNMTAIKDKGDLEKIIKEKAAYGIQILRSLLKNTFETSNSLLQLDKLNMNIIKLETIALGVIGYISKTYNIKSINEKILDNALEMYDFFSVNKVELYPLTQTVFTAPFAKILSDDQSLINELNKKEFQFFNKLYSLPSDLQNQLYSKEPYFISYYIEQSSLHFTSLSKTIGTSFHKIMDKFNSLFKPQGILHILISLRDTLKSNPELVKYIKLVVNTILSNILKVCSFIASNAPVYYSDLVSKVEKLKAINAKDSSVAEENSKIQVEESFTVPEELKGSMETILKYSEIDPEKYKEFKERYNKFKLIKEKLSGDEAIKRLRNNLTQNYWEIYEKSFLRYFKSSDMPKPVEMMLRFGLFDEELVRAKTAVMLYNTRKEPVEEDLPIYDMMEWLESIAGGRNIPSIDSMGETYEKFTREEAKRLSKKTIVTVEDVDTLDNKIAYEIKNLVKDSSKVCSGEIFNYSPILMEEAFAGESSKYFFPKKRYREEMFKVRSIDFSAFYREVAYRNSEEGIEEFVHKEVLPAIILVPSWGKRTMTWQVKERPKDSRGRIIYPHFVLDNLLELTIEVIGQYRWEIVKELLGPLWNDITQMSLTAEYVDYIQFYKKSKDLSLETKEKITGEFKKFRSDRDKFLNDYTKWIEFESDGRPLMNRVIRGIFYRQVPFPKELRDKLKETPSFAEMYTKYNNIKRKEIIRLRNKYQKYTKNGKTLPPMLEQNIQFNLR